MNTNWHFTGSFFLFRYSRLLSPRYGDGYSSPTISITGLDLPSSRLVSLVAFGEADVPDPQFTLVNMQWGQIMTHDMSMLAGSTQSSELQSFIQNASLSNVLFLNVRFRKTRNTLLYRWWSSCDDKRAQNVLSNHHSQKRSRSLTNECSVYEFRTNVDR